MSTPPIRRTTAPEPAVVQPSAPLGAAAPTSSQVTANIAAVGPTTTRVFANLAEVVYASGDAQSVMQAVVQAAVALIPGCDHATIAMLVKGEFTTAAASDDVARQVDGFERELGDGPCVDAIIGESYQADADIREHCQWPQLAERVLQQTPVRGMVGYRLLVEGQKQGALNIFSDTPGALDDHAADVGAVLAAFASMALTAALQQQRADQLQAGLASNREIGKAIGLLMATHRIDADAAFQLLRTTSSRMNVKLVQVASRVVEQAAD